MILNVGLPYMTFIMFMCILTDLFKVFFIINE